MTLQAYCALTYTGNNLYLPTPLCQDLLQGHTLAIPDPDAPTGLSPLLTTPSLDDPVNAQLSTIQVQVFFVMGQYRLSKEEAGERLEQWVHVVTKIQELRHSTRNFVRLAGDHLKPDGSLSQVTTTWPLHIDRFERQYYKAFVVNHLFWEDTED